MKYNELKLVRQKTTKRAGRGVSAGRGKTAGRGTKGQGSRKSSGVRPGFEGGQMPLYMRLPHLRGFKSQRPKTEVVYTGQLEAIKKASIDNQTLYEADLVSSPFIPVKLISQGELTNKKEVKLQAASQAAVEAVKKAGGSFTAVPRQPRPAKKNEKAEA